jgi:hypothetical protein
MRRPFCLSIVAFALRTGYRLWRERALGSGRNACGSKPI